MSFFHFIYSADQWTALNMTLLNKWTIQNGINSLHKPSVIPCAIQNILGMHPIVWLKNPLRKSVCWGLPVIIRMNIATKSSVTNDTEAVTLGEKHV